MGIYCVDASVVLAWLLEENYSQVRDFWATVNEADTIVAAQLLKPECTSVIRENAGRRLSISHARSALRRLIELPVETYLSPDQFTRALDLGQRFRLTKAYDTQYLAVAELSGAELLTIDGGMRQRAIELRIPHRLLR